MVRWIAIAAALAFTNISVPVAAERTLWVATGNDLLDVCIDPSAAWQGVCSGFIMGTIRRDALSEWMKPGTQYLCERANGLNGTTPKQLQDVVIKYLQDNPDKRHFEASSQALTALKLAFCKK